MNSFRPLNLGCEQPELAYSQFNLNLRNSALSCYNLAGGIVKNKRKFYFIGLLSILSSGLFLLFNNFSGHSHAERNNTKKSIRGLTGLVPSEGDKLEEKDSPAYLWAEDYLKANASVDQRAVVPKALSEISKLQICTSDEFEKALRSGHGQFEITCDIDFQNRKIAPISSFNGEIWGNNHQISNLNIEQEVGSYGGLFNQFSGQIDSLIFKNSHLTIQAADANLTAVGFLVGHLEPGSLLKKITFSNSSIVILDEATSDPLILGFVVGESFGNDSKLSEVQATDVAINLKSDRKMIFGQALGLGYLQMDQINLKSQIEIKDTQRGGHLIRRIVGYPRTPENKSVLVSSKIKINQDNSHE